MAPRHFFGSRHKHPKRVVARGEALAIHPDAFHQARQRQPVEHNNRLLLTTEQVRDWFQLGHVNAVYRLVRELHLPRVRLGRVYRFRQDKVDRWLDEMSEDDMQPARLVKGA